ncbi:MAG: hypothetical protein V3S47_03495 [Acidobacteriota bacterium]
MSRKYRHQGYQDSNRDDDRGGRDRSGPPRSELTHEERIQRNSLRHAIDREANEVVRCPNCGRAGDGAIGVDTRCNHCAAPLRCCRTCKQFDTGSRFQCRASIERAIGDKNKANNCTHYSPRLVLDVTGRRSPRGRNGGSSDPRSQFESLFKR